MIPGDKVWWSTTEAAAALGISEAHLRKEKAAGAIGFDQRGPGCKVRYRREHIDAYAAGVDPLADELASRRGRPA